MTLRDQLDAARRELALRRSAYPRWVSSGKMAKEKADHETAAMAAIVGTLQKCVDLDEAGLAWVTERKTMHDPKTTPQNARAAGSELEARHAGTTTADYVGPRYCAICGAWPARDTERGNRCHLCEVREWAREHPVPLPDSPAALRDLAEAGHSGAASKLAQLKNAQPSGGKEDHE